MSLIQDLRDEKIYAIKVDPEGDKVMRMNAQTARVGAGPPLGVDAPACFLPPRAALVELRAPFGFAALMVGITPLRLLPSRPSPKRYQCLLSDVTLPRVRQ